MSQILNELNEVFQWTLKMKPGIYELKEKYIVLKEVSINKTVRKRGDVIFLYPSSVKNIPSGYLKQSTDQSHKEETIRKMKQYIDFKGCLNIPEITLNSSFTKIMIHERKPDFKPVSQGDLEQIPENKIPVLPHTQ